MKKLLILALLISNIYAISIETSADTTLDDAQIDELLKMDQELDEQVKDSEDILHEQKVQEELKKSEEKQVEEVVIKTKQEDPFYYIGLGGNSGSGESELANSNGSLIDPIYSVGFLFKAGVTLSDFDFLLQYNRITIQEDQNNNSNTNAVTQSSLELQLKYRLYDFDFTSGYKLSPYVGIGLGVGKLNTSNDSLSGFNYKGDIGVQYFMDTNFVLDFAFILNYALWDYPLDGVSSHFQLGGLELSAEYRF